MNNPEAYKLNETINGKNYVLLMDKKDLTALTALISACSDNEARRLMSANKRLSKHLPYKWSTYPLYMALIKLFDDTIE